MSAVLVFLALVVLADVVAWRLGYVRSDDTGSGRIIDANLAVIFTNVAIEAVLVTGLLVIEVAKR